MEHNEPLRFWIKLTISLTFVGFVGSLSNPSEPQSEAMPLLDFLSIQSRFGFSFSSCVRLPSSFPPTCLSHGSLLAQSRWLNILDFYVVLLWFVFRLLSSVPGCHADQNQWIRRDSALALFVYQCFSMASKIWRKQNHALTTKEKLETKLDLWETPYMVSIHRSLMVNVYWFINASWLEARGSWPRKNGRGAFQVHVYFFS